MEIPALHQPTRTIALTIRSLDRMGFALRILPTTSFSIRTGKCRRSGF